MFSAEAAVLKCCVVHCGGTQHPLRYALQWKHYIRDGLSATWNVLVRLTAWLKMLQGCTDMLYSILICVLVREWSIRPEQWCHLPDSHPHPIALCARLLLFFQRRWVLRCGRVLPEQYLPQTLHRVSILPPPPLCYQHCIHKILLGANKV